MEQEVETIHGFDIPKRELTLEEATRDLTLKRNYMKKVICIDNVWTYNDGVTPLPLPTPIFGEIYTVIDYKKGEDGEWYYLEELESDWGWETCGFAPISDIDETEMERNYIKDKV